MSKNIQFNQTAEQLFGYEQVVKRMILSACQKMRMNSLKTLNIKEIGKRAGETLLIFIFCLFYRCPFKLFLHVECPGCGMTRAIISVLKLDFRQAFAYHPLFPIVILGGVYYIFRTQFRKWFHIGTKQENMMLLVAGMIFLGRWIWMRI